MVESLGNFLSDQAWAKVAQVLLNANCARSVREIIDLSGLSPGGVSDVLRRLSRHGLVQAHRVGNKRLYRLQLSEAERCFVTELFEEQTKSRLRNRAELYSRDSAKAISWIDETLALYRRTKHGVPLHVKA